MERTHKITIVVSGGMVQNVFTTLATDVTVDVLDFDDNGTRTAAERAEMEETLASVWREQRHVY